MMAMETLIYEKREHFLWIKLNRPEAMNALNTQMAEDLIAATWEAAVDPEVWVVGIGSTSAKAFGVGADLKERRDMTHAQIAAQRQFFAKAFAALKQVPQPVIAGVSGFALGGGFEMALLADMIIASESAQFGLPEVRIGLIPGGGGTQNLPRLIGRNLAKELIFTGRRIDAREALALGIVNKVVPVDQVEAAVEALAGEICASAPIAVRQAKRAMDLGMEADLRTAMEIEIEAYNVNLATEDRQEGIRAFNEKRPPRWQNR
jgi:enoyl-CoA hydratase/carnithine racemase